MRSYLVFNNTNLLDFGVHISGESTFNAPVRSISYQTVPGRDGSLIIDNGRFENVSVTYPAYIAEHFHTNIRRLRDYLSSVRGYARLEDSYHPDVFYMAAYADGINVKTSGRYSTEGQFDITFTRKPQRFLKDGERTYAFTADGSLYNPTLFDAKPLIRIYGAGTVGVGGVDITFDGATAYVDVDSDLQDAFCGATNCNSHITLNPNKFPLLSPGTNGVTVGNASRVEIAPHWYHL